MDGATLASNAAVHDETVEFHGVRAAAAAAAVISADRSHVQYQYTTYDSSGPSYFARREVRSVASIVSTFQTSRNLLYACTVILNDF